MTVNVYVGFSRPFGQVGKNNRATIGSSSTATTEIEMRVMTTTTTGSHLMTVYEVLQAIEQFREYFIKGGGALTGVDNSQNLPLQAPQHGA